MIVSKGKENQVRNNVFCFARHEEVQSDDDLLLVR